MEEKMKSKCKIDNFAIGRTEACSMAAKGKEKPQIYLLIAGAWHTGWFWNAVKETLVGEGHRVIAVDLPGHGNNKLPLNEQNLESYARFVADIIDEQPEAVILVGHSMAGAVACQTAEYKAEKIKKLVILCGFLLNDGESINGLKDGIKPTDWRKIVEMRLGKLSSDKKISYIDPEIAKKNFYGNMTDEQATLAVEHLNGEAIAAQWQAVKLGRSFKSVSKVYIRTLQDKMLPIELQDKMIERGVESVYEINSGHSPFLTATSELTDVLLDIAANLKVI